MLAAFAIHDPRLVARGARFPRRPLPHTKERQQAGKAQEQMEQHPANLRLKLEAISPSNQPTRHRAQRRADDGNAYQFPLNRHIRKRQPEQQRFNKRKSGRNEKAERFINAFVAGTRRIGRCQFNFGPNFAARDSHDLTPDLSLETLAFQARWINPKHELIPAFDRKDRDGTWFAVLRVMRKLAKEFAFGIHHLNKLFGDNDGGGVGNIPGADDSIVNRRAEDWPGRPVPQVELVN